MVVSRKVISRYEIDAIVYNMSKKIYGASQAKLVDTISDLFRQIIFDEFVKNSTAEELYICNKIIDLNLQRSFLNEVTTYSLRFNNPYDHILLNFSPPLYFTNAFVSCVLYSDNIKNLKFSNSNHLLLNEFHTNIQNIQKLNNESKDFKNSTQDILLNLRTYGNIVKEFPEINEYVSDEFKLLIDSNASSLKIEAIREQLKDDNWNYSKRWVIK